MFSKCLHVVNDTLFVVMFADEAFRASAPINHFRFIDLITIRISDVEARAFTHRAINVRRISAHATDQMMMIVAHAIFIQRRRSRRLNPPQNPLLGKHSQRIINRLTRDGPQLGSNVFNDSIRRTMRLPTHRPHHSQTLSRHLHIMFAEYLRRVMNHGMDIVQLWTLSRPRSLEKSGSTHPIFARTIEVPKDVVRIIEKEVVREVRTERSSF